MQKTAYRYYPLFVHFRREFGRRIQKIPLDAGFHCPNRDGTLSRKGCVFCNPLGSGSGLGEKGLGLEMQWDYWREHFSSRRKTGPYMAYLQSYSNTYGPLDKLARILGEISGLPDLAGISLGTRPDCLDQDKIGLLAALPVREVILELGLQSADDRVLEFINRGHTVEDFVRAVDMAARCGLKVCAHVVAGLPGPDGGEGLDGLLRSVELLNSLPVQGVKFHNLYVCRGAGLEALWRKGEFVPLERETYIYWIGQALARLRPDIVVHRLNGDPSPGELLAPGWAGKKGTLLHMIRNHLEAEDIWQGKSLPEWSREIPFWFSPENGFGDNK